MEPNASAVCGYGFKTGRSFYIQLLTESVVIIGTSLKATEQQRKLMFAI